MNNKLIQMGRPEAIYNSNGTRVLRYSVEVYHTGLNEHKVLTAPEIDMLENKLGIQIDKWEEKWEQIEKKKTLSKAREANKEEAIYRTEEAQERLEEIEELLIHTLGIDDTIDWNKLKSRKKFNEPNPLDSLQKRINEIPIPVSPKLLNPAPEPLKNSDEFLPKLGFLDKIFSSRKKKKEFEANEKFKAAYESWEAECQRIKSKNIELKNIFNESTKKYDTTILSIKTAVEGEQLEWEKRKNDFLQKQVEYNQKINEMKARYFEQDETSIAEYCEMVLNNSDYPESFTIDFQLEYIKESRILIVEYNLPPIEVFPKIKEVKYIASKNELVEVNISDVQLNKMYDEALYKIALRSIHELFEADKANALEAVSFNGWVSAINKANGQLEHNCILSIQARKEEFEKIDLAKVDPKVCFKNLKGVASSKLSALTPVQPIIQMNKSDKRFVEGYNVVGGIDNSTNLAAMDWEDFEHLIRELFEKEFAVNGGDVKVTQASRDGGVDAIAFDPDPIRGGKIVIQAKRYTNTVSVSAVRDLYGTVMSEGATKGILVSTADYGPDAYEFAKGKPITLLNGSNLLHLLEKHGHHAKIDLKEAKLLLQTK